MLDDAPERRLRLIVSDELGVVRVAEAAGRSKIDDLAFAKRWGDADRSRRVVRCRAGEDGDGDGDALGGRGTCAAAGWLALGRKDGTAEVIDTATGGDVGGGALDIGGVPVGVQVFGPGAGREGARLVTVTDAGEAAVYDAACDAARDDGSLASRLAPLRVVQEWSPAAKWKACDAALVARALGCLRPPHVRTRSSPPSSIASSDVFLGTFGAAGMKSSFPRKTLSGVDPNARDAALRGPPNWAS